MKKLISAIAITSVLSAPAHALSINNYLNGHHDGYHAGYNSGYRNGYHAGKDHVAKNVMIVAGIAIVAVAVYELGKNSRWTANQDGIAYRF